MTFKLVKTLNSCKKTEIKESISLHGSKPSAWKNEIRTCSNPSTLRSRDKLATTFNEFSALPLESTPVAHRCSKLSTLRRKKAIGISIVDFSELPLESFDVSNDRKIRKNVGKLDSLTDSSTKSSIETVNNLTIRNNNLQMIRERRITFKPSSITIQNESQNINGGMSGRNIISDYFMVNCGEFSFDPPNSSKSWSQCYISIGSVYSKPWMMHIYQSKSDFDRAIQEKISKKPVSADEIKIDIRNFKIINRAQGPSSVYYESQGCEWRYFILKPRETELSIKISSESSLKMKPLFQAISRIQLSSSENNKVLKDAHHSNFARIA